MGFRSDLFYFLQGPTSISYPDLTYTGNTMTLLCGPPQNIDVGQISDSEWTFRGREIKNGIRMKITTSDRKSMLKVNNVILADTGKSKLAVFLDLRFIHPICTIQKFLMCAMYKSMFHFNYEIYCRIIIVIFIPLLSQHCHLHLGNNT